MCQWLNLWNDKKIIVNDLFLPYALEEYGAKEGRNTKTFIFMYPGYLRKHFKMDGFENQ